jgi:hypothetical protein
MYTISVSHNERTEATAKALKRIVKPLEVSVTDERVSIGTSSQLTYVVLVDIMRECEECPAAS